MSSGSAPWLAPAWTADNPRQIRFVDVPRDAGAWASGPSPHFQYRDLGLADASDGALSVSHLRAADPGAGRSEPAWRCHDLNFHFSYVLKGSIRMRSRGGEDLLLHAGDSCYLPPLYFYSEVEHSPDYEAVQIIAPAVYATIDGLDSPLPDRAAQLDPDRQPIITREVDENYVSGDGPRSFFAYRDLCTREPTQGRIHIHSIRVADPTRALSGTGWHYHTMAQWFFILDGGTDFGFESDVHHRLAAGDSVCVGAGPHMRHFVDDLTGDYRLIEMCVPGRYDTIAVDAPKGVSEQ